MKIISLNIWAGRINDKLINFFNQNNDVDIFCLQEVYNGGANDKRETAENINSKDYEIFSKINTILIEHQGYFRPHLKDYYGLSIFIKKDINVLEEGDVFVYKHKEYIPEGNLGFHARNIQYIKIVHNNQPLTVINFHGLWNNQGKTDTEDRIQQSKNIIDFIKKIDGEVILCGDFNLLPETESIKMLENSGLRNLIKENNIESTRTSLYEKSDKLADYVFVSNDINVKIEVLKDEISDHNPVLIEIK